MKALVTGAGGFIGGHMVSRLKKEGYYVVGVDVEKHGYRESDADVFLIEDLMKPEAAIRILESVRFDEIYNFAARMGGAGFVFTGRNDADIMRCSCSINLSMLGAILAVGEPYPKIFYSSSACVYPERAMNGGTVFAERHAYPAMPDNDYGWEKLFSERVYFAHNRNYGIPVRIARFHNIYGPFGAWCGGREKSIAAMCRKVAEARDGTAIEIWGDGSARRSFLFVEDCVDTIRKFVDSDITGPLNIGSDLEITMRDLCETIIRISGKTLEIRSIPGPVGVQSRNADNSYIQEALGFAPDSSRERLEACLKVTYDWIAGNVEAAKKS